MLLQKRGYQMRVEQHLPGPISAQAVDKLVSLSHDVAAQVEFKSEV